MLVEGKNGLPTERVPVSLGVIVGDLARHLQRIDEQPDAQMWIDRVRSTENLEAPPSGPILSEFIRICMQVQQQALLAHHRLPHPTYNYFESFVENAVGPKDMIPPAWCVPVSRSWNVLGFDVGFPIGVPASVITPTAIWIEYYARLGFNILTYKTVRSEFRDAHPEPNWVFLKDLDQPLSPGEYPDHVAGDLTVWPLNVRAVSTANSFGVPSFHPDFWQPDIARALNSIQSHQLLIASVMGTFERYRGEAMVEDFVRVARMAEDAGAEAIELNLSCPNTVDPATKKVNEMVCDSAEVTQRITSRVREALKGNTRLIVKLGYMPRGQLESVVRPIAEAGLINGVAGINTVAMKVVDLKGHPVFPNRDRAGVSGVAIREFGLQFVRWLAEIRQEHELSFDIIGMGGVMNSEDVLAYQNAGAAAVQAVTSAFLNPYLAQEVCEALGGLESGAVAESSNLPRCN